MNLNLICSLLVPCNIGYQTMKMLIYKNCVDWHWFILHPVMDQNYDRNIGFYILYTTQVYYLTYNTLLFMLFLFKCFRIKYNDSRELLIMMIIINVLQVIINHVVNMYESHYESYCSWSSISLQLVLIILGFTQLISLQFSVKIIQPWFDSFKLCRCLSF